MTVLLNVNLWDFSQAHQQQSRCCFCLWNIDKSCSAAATFSSIFRCDFFRSLDLTLMGACGHGFFIINLIFSFQVSLKYLDNFLCESLFVGKMCPKGRLLPKWPKNNEYHWLPTYSSLDSVKCVMGYTQRFTTIEHKVAPRSAWVQSLWSRLWVFSLCAVFDMYTSL